MRVIKSEDLFFREHFVFGTKITKSENDEIKVKTIFLATT